MPEITIPAINWTTALPAAIRGARSGDVIIVRTEPMRQLALAAAGRMGKTGVIFKVAEAPDA